MLPYSILSGVTDIGEDCEIGPGARISDAKIGNHVSVRDSYIVAGEVGDEHPCRPVTPTLGPAASVGADAKIGNFRGIEETRS